MSININNTPGTRGWSRFASMEATWIKTMCLYNVLLLLLNLFHIDHFQSTKEIYLAPNLFIFWGGAKFVVLSAPYTQ